jgi:hypothetical protein
MMPEPLLCFLVIGWFGPGSKATIVPPTNLAWPKHEGFCKL